MTEKETLDKLIKQGESLCYQKGYDDARRIFESVLKQEPMNARAHNNLGVVYYHLNRKEKSLAHYKRAMELMPTDINYLKNCADLLFVSCNKPAEALEIYNRVLAMEPEDTEALLGVGIISQFFSQNEDARFFFEKVIQIDPDNDVARARLKELDSNFGVS